MNDVFLSEMMMRIRDCSVAFLLIALSGQQQALAQAANAQHITCVLEQGEAYATERDLIGDWKMIPPPNMRMRPPIMQIRPGTQTFIEPKLAIGVNWRLKDKGVFEAFEAKKPNDIRRSCAKIWDGKLVFISEKGVRDVWMRIK